jgi:carbon storage regulator
MLVLTRRISESIIIDGEIKVTVLQIDGSRIRLGISAPASVSVVRGELLERDARQVSSAASLSPLNEAGRFDGTSARPDGAPDAPIRR